MWSLLLKCPKMRTFIWTEEKSEIQLNRDILVYFKKTQPTNKPNKQPKTLGAVKEGPPQLWSLEANLYCIISSSHLENKLTKSNLLKKPRPGSPGSLLCQTATEPWDNFLLAMSIKRGVYVCWGRVGGEERRKE